MFGTIKHLTMAVAVLSLITADTSPAAAAFITITVDESGNGNVVNLAFGTFTLQSAMRPDPGPGGLASALTYELRTGPLFSEFEAGDIILLEPGTGQVSDILRFNPDQTLVFYSDNGDVGGNLADTGFPGALYANNRTFIEVGPEGLNGFTYTPGRGDPGSSRNDIFPVTYVFRSDNDTAAVPEPSSLALLSLGGIALATGWRPWRTRRPAMA